MKKLALLIPVLTLLLACENDSNDFRTLNEVINPANAPPDPRVQPLIDAGVPRLQVAFLETGKSGVLLLENTRDGVKTWLSSDGATLLTRDGMIVGSRGFGGGMMASDVSESISAVYGGYTGDVLRFHTFTTGEDKIETRSYKCVIENRGNKTITVQGRPVSTRLTRETCHNSDQSFLNLYWMSNQTGRMVQSRQWLGDFLQVINLREMQQ